MKKKVFVLILCLLTMTFGCNLISSKDDNKVMSGADVKKPVVMVTNYPLFFFTNKIAVDKLDVQSLIPPGVEPHSWEPSPRDLINLEKTDLLIYNGAGLEDWIIDISKTLENKEIAVVDASRGVELIRNSESDHGQYDPHIWLDPINSEKIVNNILKALIEKNPENGVVFTANAEQLIEQLHNLDKAYEEEFKNSENKVFAVNHAAFGYLAKRYGLIQVAVMGINPHTEPTPQKVVDLLNLIKEHKLKCIFTETLVSSRVAEVLAKEAGITTKVLNPLGNLTKEDLEAAKDYFSIMYENLGVLKEGLAVN